MVVKVASKFFGKNYLARFKKNSVFHGQIE
jgi:hypothetical protein